MGGGPHLLWAQRQVGGAVWGGQPFTDPHLLCRVLLWTPKQPRLSSTPLLPPPRGAPVNLGWVTAARTGWLRPHSSGQAIFGAPTPRHIPGPLCHPEPGILPDGSLRSWTAHLALFLPSRCPAPGTPAPPSRLGRAAASCPCCRPVALLHGGRGPTWPESRVCPIFAGPAVPRRNLIALFSWFRFCFLIKKMTLLGPGALWRSLRNRHHF